MVKYNPEPMSLLYAFGGDAVFRGSTLRIIVAVVLILLIFAVLFKVYRQFERHHQKKAEM